MDRVRFGRALGGGAREAAKALLRAADAAAAPSPSPPVTASRTQGVSPPRAPAPTRISAVNAARSGPSVAGLKQHGRRFGQAVWAPFARHSGVLWLEFTGVFFGLFTLSLGVGLWQHRAQLFSAGFARDHRWFAVLMFLCFGYFCISSFVRAARRGRQ